MKFMKIYIVTYKRNDILNDTLNKLFASDFTNYKNTEVNIINNHSNFYLAPVFRDKVRVLHNMMRPDWSNGNLSENWNQALLDGFRDLNNPDAQYVVTMQNDTSVYQEWCGNLLEMHKDFNFIVGKFGDNLVSYTPQAVKKIGMWDENFAGIGYKEADYWLRALIFNKERSCINDTLHGIELNSENALEIDTTINRNFIDEYDKNLDSVVLKRKPDDIEQQDIWQKSRGGMYKAHAWKYFCSKWSGTWVEEPTKVGWIKHWPQKLIDNPPIQTKSKIKIIMRYLYFEKDILGLQEKNYLI